MESMHSANRVYWNAIAEQWKKMRDDDALWQQCPRQPELGLPPPTFDLIQMHAGSLARKSVCVLGSGDNHAAFALAGLDAQVTSVDFSEQQLAVAASRADSLGLPIDFVQADITDMPQVQSDRYDLVCATNGVLVWLSDLKPYFAEVFRILSRNSYLVFYDVHPFQRPWQDTVDQIVMQKPYFDHGPFPIQYQIEAGPGAMHGQPQLTRYEFHWTMGHIVNAVLASGLRLCSIRESLSEYPQFWKGASLRGPADERLLDWQVNPRAGLPVWLTVVAQK
jgi:SAM-dependent methyltransferase